MVKLETIKDFTLKDFTKLRNVKRAKGMGVQGLFKPGDTFECDEEMAKYLMGENAIKEVVAKVIEVIPEAIVTEPIITEPITEEKEEPKKDKKSKKKK